MNPFRRRRPVSSDLEPPAAPPVEDGEVRFMVAPRRTWGMSMTIETPWEGQTGYVTSVVQRYRGKAVGDRVSFKQARKAGVATSCWAGTRSDEVRTTVVVRTVTSGPSEPIVAGESPQ